MANNFTKCTIFTLILSFPFSSSIVPSSFPHRSVTDTFNKLFISQNILVEIKNVFLHWIQYKILSNKDFRSKFENNNFIIRIKRNLYMELV